MTRTGRILALLAAAGLLGTPVQAASPEEELRELLHRARSECEAREPERQAAGLELCREGLAHGAATLEQRVELYRCMIEAHVRHARRYGEGVTVCREMAEAFPDTPHVRASAALRLADIFWRWQGEEEQALRQLEEVLARESADPDTLAQMLIWQARFLGRLKRWEDAYGKAQQARNAAAANPDIAWRALHEMQAAAGAAKNHEGRREALLELLSEPYAGALSEWDVEGRRGDLFYVLMELHRYDELRRYFAAAEEAEPDPRRAQRYGLMQAESYQAEERFDEALTSLQRVFTRHSRSRHYWYNAQERVVDVLRRQGHLDEALRHARVLFDAAGDGNTLANACNRIVQILLELDDDPRRANRFVTLQLWGPDGQDGEPGTEDDPAENPLLNVPYPDLSDRNTAFETMRGTLGDDTEAMRQRAASYLFAGQPREALLHSLDALSRCHPYAIEDVARECVTRACRACQGHSHGLESAMSFIARGPGGPDGREGSDDDLPDPFAALIGEHAPRPGGRAGLPGTEIEKLDRLAAGLFEVVRDNADMRSLRVTAADTLCRVWEALVVWRSRETQAMVLEALSATSDREQTRALLRLGQHAAKGGSPHLGGVWGFWEEVERLETRGRAALESGARDNERKSFERAVQGLERELKLVPRLKLEPAIAVDGEALPAVAVEGVVPGLRFASYEGEFGGSMPDFAALEPVLTGHTEGVRVDVAKRRENMALVFDGFLALDRAGPYRFQVKSCDGSRLFIGDRLVVDNDGDHGAQEAAGSVDLQPGLHPLRLEFYCRGKRPVLDIHYERFRMGKRRVPNEVYRCLPPVP